MSSNPELDLARRIVENTGTHLFLTGKAGTGKTTFLKDLKKRSPKRMVVTAPTGIAAINAGGMTLQADDGGELGAAGLPHTLGQQHMGGHEETGLGFKTEADLENAEVSSLADSDARNPYFPPCSRLIGF